MDRFEWDPSLDTGDSTVDTQHRELVRMINALHVAEAEQAGGNTIPDTLTGLAEYVGTHFACEHELMVEYGMPSEFVEQHTHEHRALTDRTRDFVLAYRRGEVDSTVPIAEFLQEWLLSHILTTDKRLVEYVKAAKG